jgi:drug/metabolite transporter (DMT)-like permease
MGGSGEVNLRPVHAAASGAWTAIGVAAMVATTMAAFAANSVICRLALGGGLIDAPRFTAVRLLSGAAMLALFTLEQRPSAERGRFDPWAAGALFVYAAAFSFAYVELAAGVGALLLFGAVQVTMIGAGLARGERLAPLASLGLMLALGGLGAYLAPSGGVGPSWAAISMLLAGAAWGLYSLRGARQADPVIATVWNFIATVPAAFVLLALPRGNATFSADGFALAVLSGAVTSGLGYVLWYRVLAHIPAITAAVVQLCVPLLAAAFGVALLGEHFTPRLALAGVAVLGGIGLVILSRRMAATTARR